MNHDGLIAVEQPLTVVNWSVRPDHSRIASGYEGVPAVASPRPRVTFYRIAFDTQPIMVILALRLARSYKYFPILTPLMHILLALSIIDIIRYFNPPLTVVNPLYAIWGIVAFGGMSVVIAMASEAAHVRKKKK